MQAPLEQLGSFYIGGVYDVENRNLGAPLLYDARDLTTHAVCVGMTGSGKTGLCIGLLEEAALDMVPALILDPKGDITNLLLQFPDLRPQDFEPWINSDDARRKGKTVEEYADATADLWRNGLAEWGVTGERIRSLGESADFTIFTPGSDAGVGVNIMGSMAAPAGNFDDDAEMLRERISGTVAALLGLVEVKSDPVRGREGVLLANIFETFWRRGEDVDLPKLILAIQDPPVRQLGVFDVDTFYPQKDRTQLAMAFNNLIASPTFGEWLQGEPLDVDSLLYQADGRPRHSVFYLAHLTDSERMFFVTLLLESTITWMRRQSGTTSLRALLYFDEVFGFFPPTAEPPSKRPLLTIMKQARAFGLGAVLVTQNPVDIDYKGLSNAGTWFIGKLQTERDKERVLAGLEGAIADAGGEARVTDFGSLINRLDSRVFLMHNVHEDAPAVFHTRWAMSYLRGPLTRPQVRTLMEGAGKRASVAEPDGRELSTTAGASQPIEGAPQTTELPSDGQAADGLLTSPMQLDAQMGQRYLPTATGPSPVLVSVRQEEGQGIDIKSVALVYQPGALGLATVHFVDKKRGLHVQREVRVWAPVTAESAAIRWEESESIAGEDRDLRSSPESAWDQQGPYYAPVPSVLDSEREIKSARAALSDWLYYGSSHPLTVHEALGVHQEGQEGEREFAIRLRQAAREARDSEVDSLEAEYAKRIDRIQAKIDLEARKAASLEADYSSRKQQELVGLGEGVLNYFLGRRSSRVLSGASSRRRMTVKARYALDAAQEKIEDYQAEVVALQAELAAEADEITVRWANVLEDVTIVELKPRRTDVEIRSVDLAWAPFWMVDYEKDGTVVKLMVPAYLRAEDSTA